MATRPNQQLATHRQAPLLSEDSNLPLFQEAHARHSDPQTSKDAAKSVVNLGRTRESILRILKIIGPATDQQISDYAEQYALNPVSPSGLRSRRSELVAMGFVVDSGQRAKTQSGRDSIVWQVAK